MEQSCYLRPQLCNPLDVLVEEVFPCNIRIKIKMIYFLEVQQFIEINLRSGPTPEKIPRSFQRHTVRKFVPAVLAEKSSCYDVVHFLLTYHHSVVECIVWQGLAFRV